MTKSNTSFKSTFIKVLSFFFAFYIVMMGIFTFLKVESTKMRYDSEISNLLNRPSQEFAKNIADYNNAQLNEGALPYLKSKENLITNMCTSIDLYLRGLTINEIYAKSALFSSNGDLIAKSGNLLRCDESIKNADTSSWHLYCYLDLDKVMSQDEIIWLYNLKSSETRNKTYSFDVEGYAKGAEIIPQKISIFEEQWTQTSKSTRELTNKPVIKELNFTPENIEGLKKYKPTYNQLYLINDINISDMSTIKLNVKTMERYNLCNDAFNFEAVKTDTEYSSPVLLARENGFNKVKYLITYPFEVSDSKYYLSLSTVYYPLEVAIKDLMLVYSFSLMMVFVLSAILAFKLWDIYKKQQQLEKNRRDMTNSIGHDLKTPLAIIRTYSEGLKEQIAENKKDHYLDVIIDETTKMDKMVLEMLDLSKLEAKAYVLKIESFCINTLVKKVLKDKERLISDKGIYLIYKEDKDWSIEADYKRIEQVFANLVSNAISFTTSSGKITVEIKEGKLYVTNEGKHIAEDKKTLIWNAFYKDDKSRQRGSSGTGLGLSIVKNILELHHMPYGVENIYGGVQFWFGFAKK